MITLPSKLTDAEAEIVFRKVYEHNYGDGYYAVENMYTLLAGYHLLVMENRAS